MLGDIVSEDLTVHWSVEYQGRDDAVVTQAGNKCGGAPMPMRSAADQALLYLGKRQVRLSVNQAKQPVLVVIQMPSIVALRPNLRHLTGDANAESTSLPLTG